MAMNAGLKWVLAGSALLVVAVGGELLYIHHRNTQDAAAPVSASANYKSDPDDLVFLKQEHPMSLKDEKDLKGRTLWVSAGAQMDYYPYNGHVDWDHSHGVLLGAEPIVVKDAVEAVAPAKTAFRIPAGDKQILLVFTVPNDPNLYASPVGFVQNGETTFLTDQIYFYDDPHQLFSYWGPQVWKAIDAHQAIAGMSERQVQTALGQVSTPHGDDTGNRTVTYDDQGHPKNVTFVNNKATRIEDVKQ